MKVLGSELNAMLETFPGSEMLKGFSEGVDIFIHHLEKMEVGRVSIKNKGQGMCFKWDKTKMRGKQEIASKGVIPADLPQMATVHLNCSLVHPDKQSRKLFSSIFVHHHHPTLVNLVVQLKPWGCFFLSTSSGVSARLRVRSHTEEHEISCFFTSVASSPTLLSTSDICSAARLPDCRIHFENKFPDVVKKKMQLFSRYSYRQTAQSNPQRPLILKISTIIAP